MARLALFDLDNTLLDRQAAFNIWARRFITAQGLPSEAWSTIESSDQDGLRPREEFFTQIKAELGLAAHTHELLDSYRLEYPACFAADDETVRAVRDLRKSGWKVGVVTNGPPTQLAKLEATSLVHEFDAICISALVGFQKPRFEIFAEAARMCQVPLEGWMVGDSASADIAGGLQAGLRTIWIARDRTWDVADFEPDATVATVAEAVALILSQGMTRQVLA